MAEYTPRNSGKRFSEAVAAQIQTAQEEAHPVWIPNTIYKENAHDNAEKPRLQHTTEVRCTRNSADKQAHKHQDVT